MRTLSRVGAGLLALTLVGGIAACGDDDDDATTDTTAASGDGDAASGDNAAFCDGVLEFNGAVMQVELDEESSPEDIKAAGDGLIPVFAKVVDNAPEELADQANELNDAITPLADGDATAFNADSTFESYTEFVGGAVDACDFDTVDVTAKDYAFEAPDTIEAGQVAFAFKNSSEGEEHEMVVMRKADGVDLSFDELLALPEEEAQTKAEFVGFAFAPPGGEASNLAELEPGQYAMVCFIPVGGAEDGPPHFTQGMVHEFTVE